MEYIDIKGGKLTYRQRIELNDILMSDVDDFEKCTQAFKCLHDRQPNLLDTPQLPKFFDHVIEGVLFWSEQETLRLNYKPTSDELASGINEYAKQVGVFGTVKSLAKAYSTDPDQVMDWEYGKVFMILVTDLAQYHYEQAYNKTINEKYSKSR